MDVKAKTAPKDDRSPVEREYLAQREAYDQWVAMLDQFPIRSNPSAWIENAFRAGWIAHKRLTDDQEPRAFCED